MSWTAPDANGTTITGYKAQYRKKVAEGETANAWTAYTGTLSATDTTFNLPGLDAGATYEAQVRAITGEEGEGPWSDTGEGTANRPPAATSVSFGGGTFPVGTIADYKETGQGALGIFFQDADSDTLTYSASAQHPALLGVSLSGEAGEAHLQATVLNQGVSKLNFTASDPYGGQVTRSTTITITATTSREIAENSAAGTAVGDPVTGTPYDDGDPQTDDALTYTLTGNAADSDLFVIDSSTGQISVAPGAPIDYETDDEYREIEYWPPDSGTVHAKFYRGQVNYAVDGHDAVIDVSIKVTDVAPGKPDTPLVTRTTFSEPSDPALDVTWTATAANGLTTTGYEARYRVKVAEGETPNAWTNYTGALDATATSLNLPDLEAGDTYEAQVRAVARDGGDTDIALSVNPASFNEGASAAQITVTATRQGTSGAATVTLRTFGGTANDATDFTTFTWPNVTIPDGRTSGSATLTFTGWNDTEVEGSESLIISGTSAGLTVGKAIVTIIDDELPGPIITGWEIGPWSDIGEGTANTPPNLTTKSIAAFSLQWFKFGNSLSTTDLSNGFFQDADGDTLTYSTSSEYPGVIKAWIDSVTLKIQTRNPTAAATTVTYGAHDGYGGYASRTVQVTGTIGTIRQDVPENTPAGNYVRLVKGVDYDDGDPETDDTLTYTLSGDAFDSGTFAYDAATGWISVAKGLDYETKSSYTGTLSWTVQDQTATATVAITVTDLQTSKAGTPTLTRTEFSEPTSPGLDVSWGAAPTVGWPINPLTVTGYEAQYRKKVAEGETANAWVDYTYTNAQDETVKLVPRTSLSLTGLDAGATYEAQVRAVTSQEGEGPWSDIGEGTANTPPTTSGADLADANVAVGSTGSYAISGKFTDADSDTLTYSASSQYPGVLTAAITGNDSDTLTVTPVNPAAAIVTYGASDGYGGYVSRTVAITGTASVTRSVAENSAAGTAVGDPVTGTPHGTETLSYTLSGDAATAFVIDSSTGQISVKSGTALDSETKSSYTGQVTYTVQERSASVSLTITVTDVQTGKPAAPTLTRTEFSRPTDPALDVTWAAPDDDGLTITGYKAQYRKKVAEGETANAWTDYTYTDSNGNTVSQLPATTTSINLPDLDAGATYEAQVRAVDENEGEGPWSDIGEGTANTPPTTSGADLAAANVAVGSTGSYAISGKFTDADSDTLTYSASSQYPGVLTAAITGNDSDTLTVTPVNPAAAIVTYGASDGYGGYVSRTVTVTGTSSVTRSISESSSAGTSVGDPVTGTPHGEETLSYSLTGDATAAFVIDSSTGQISVKQGATLDYETKSSYTGQVTWTVQGQTATVSLTIELANTSAPSKPDAPTVTRSTTDPTTTLDAAWTAPADNGSPITGYGVQYRVSGTQDSWSAHAVTGTGTSTTLTGLTEDTTYEVQVRASNAEGTGVWSDSGEGSTAAENLPPQFSTQASVREVPENSPAGTVVGDPVTAVDSEGHTLIYALKTPSPLFTVDSATGQISVAQGASLDFEAQDSYTVVIEASDGLSVHHVDDGDIIDAETTVTIRVTDANEPPPAPAAPSAARSSASPTSSLRVTWTAPDTTGKPPVTSYAISYRKKGTSQSEERSLTGLQAHTTLTGLEPGTTYEVSVKASNDEGRSPWSDFGEGSTARRSTPTPPDDTPPTPPAPPSTPTPTPPGTPTPTLPSTPTPTPPGTPTPTPPGTPTPTPPSTPTPTPPDSTPTPTPSSTPAPPSTPTPAPPDSTPTPEPTSPGNTPTPEPGPPGTPSPGNAPSGGPTLDFRPGEGQPGRAQRVPFVTGASAPTPTPTAVTGAPTATPTPTPTPTPEPAALPATSTMPTTGVPPSAGSGPAVVSAYASGFVGTITDDGMTTSSILIPLFLLLLLLIALLRLLRRRAVRRPRPQGWVTPEGVREHRPVVTRDAAPRGSTPEMPRLRPERHVPPHRPAAPHVPPHRPAAPSVASHRSASPHVPASRPASPHVSPHRPASPHVPPHRRASPSVLASILDSHYRENGGRLGGK